MPLIDRTYVRIAHNPKLETESSMAFMGSCFAEQSFQRFSNQGLSALFSPFGITYNPVALAEHLSQMSGESEIKEDLVQDPEGRWFSFDHHGSFNSKDRSELIELTKGHFSKFKSHLKNTKLLTLTLGTSFAYFHSSLGRYVNNCHKQDGKFFERHLLSENEMYLALSESLKHLKLAYPNLNIVLTVSPVRHIRDSAIENTRSKARLIELAHKLAEQQDHIDYFPSYELLLDELRDYRYYAEDLCHPSTIATDYICEKFEETYFEDSSLLKPLKALAKRRSHRPIFSDSESFKEFSQETERIAEQLQSRFPNLNLM